MNGKGENGGCGRVGFLLGCESRSFSTSAPHKLGEGTKKRALFLALEACCQLMKGIPDLLEMSSTSLGGENGLIYSNNCCADWGRSVRWLGFLEKLLVAVVNAGVRSRASVDGQQRRASSGELWGLQPAQQQKSCLPARTKLLLQWETHLSPPDVAENWW